MLALVKAALPRAPLPLAWVMLMPPQSLLTTPQVELTNTLGQVGMPTASWKVVKILAALAPVISVASRAAPFTFRVPFKNLTTEPWGTVMVVPEVRLRVPMAGE